MVTQGKLRTCEVKQLSLLKINFKIATAVDLNECLKQAKLPIFLHTIPELPSDKSTMTKGDKIQNVIIHCQFS